MNKETFWQHRIIGIRRFELVLFLLFYTVFGFGYYLTIELATNSGNISNAIIDYSIKAIFTYPIWWLLIKQWRDRPILKKIWWHLLFLPVFVLGWQQVYYFVLESIGKWHLTGGGQWWDIYIPSMFYFIQFGVFHVYDYYQQIREKELQAAELRELALKSELTALKAQLNPHFLYNTFNTISASVPPEQEYTRELIATLSDLFRFQLKATKNDRVSLKEELGFLKKYLELEKARFGNRLKIEFNIAPESLEASIPPILLQPIVENAIKHGVAPKIKGGTVSILASVANHFILFKIKDNGIGLNPKYLSKNEGLGLSNTKKRLAKIYDEDLTIQNQPTGGVIVEFKIPFQKYQKKTHHLSLIPA